MQSIVAKTLVKLSIQNTYKTENGIVEADKYDSCMQENHTGTTYILMNF